MAQQPLISLKKVKPSGPEDAELLFIAEAPGYEEDVEGVPLVGDAGKLFNNVLSIAGFQRSKVRCTNICNYRPANNKWEYLENSWQLEEGIDEAREYIRTHKDRLKFVVVCGAKPLEYLLGRRGIEKWRSSVIEQDGLKYFCSYHPSAVLYNGPLFSIITFDFRKLYRYVTEGYTKPSYNFTLDPSGIELEESVRELESHKRLYVDIESVKGTTKILCCGFATSPSRAVVFGNKQYDKIDSQFYSICSRILENPKIEKVFQNGFGYDVEVFRENGIDVKGYVYDTMIGAHVLEPELPYKLSFLTTLYTDQAYYKDKGRSAIPDDEVKGWSEKIDKPTLYEYNATDCVVTASIAIAQIQEIKQNKLGRTLDYKWSLIPLSQELSRNGMEVNVEKKEMLRQAVKLKWKYFQEIINAIAGYPVNVKSGPTLKKLLITDFKLPERHDRVTKQITFNEDAIVSYFAWIQNKINDSRREETIESWTMRLAACKCILFIREYRQLLSNYINIKFSADGRVRSIYNLSAATETGRGSSHKWIDQSGNNAQTWPRKVLELDDKEIEVLIKKGLLNDPNNTDKAASSSS